MTVVPPVTAPLPLTRRRSGDLASRASRVIAGLANVPLPLGLLDLDGFTIQGVNSQLLELTGLRAEQLVGRRPVDFAPPARRSAVRADQQALAEHRLEAFQASREFHLPTGETLDANVWASRFAFEGEEWGLGVVLPTNSDTRLAGYVGFAGAIVDVMMAVTDHGWVLEHVSADARAVVGTPAEDLVGQPLLGMVHPGDAAGLVTTVANAVSSNTSVACRARVRSRDQQWTDVTCTVSALCQHSPPRLGLAMSRRPDGERGPQRLRRRTLEQTLWRIAMELRAAGLISDDPVSVTRAPPGHTAQLSGRQWEILQRITQGQTVARIASEMYLSRSTVRNHLVAIYRKFGVHSQVQLMAALGDGDDGSR